MRAVLRAAWGRLARWPPANLYEELYERYAGSCPDDAASGDGDFALIGRIELGVLLMEGLRPDGTVVDFGCGTGRLAVHLVPALRGGHYIGIDISRVMLERARTRVARAVPAPACRVTWLRQTASRFPLEDGSADLLCAFSVFTHMEHEDTYRYLEDARRVVRPHGTFVLSCLPMELGAARDIFKHSAAADFRRRWSTVRNVTTSTDLMSSVAALAGWTVRRWYRGDEPNIRLPGSGEVWPLGQSVCVLEAPG